MPIRCAAAARRCARIEEVGDVWLDAGIVPFSTLGWQNDATCREGYATGAARGLTTADLPDHANWEHWFPADWVSEMREQIRLWFYSQLFMSVALDRPGAVPQGARLREDARRARPEMHGSWGNMIDAEDAFARMGADVMRWQYCAQPPDRNLLFGFGPAQEIKRKLLTLWNSARLPDPVRRTSSRSRPATRISRRARSGAAAARPLARRANTQLVAEATAAYESWLTVDVIRAFDAFVDDLSNWYIRRSRRRFWDGDDVALRTLWHAIVQGLRVVSPVMPFLAEHLWQTLVTEACEARRPPSSWPAGRRPLPRTMRCWQKWPTCAASWRSATRRASRPVSRCASPCAHRRRRRPSRLGARGRDRGGAAREERGVRPGRCRAAGQAPPAGAGAEARKGARRSAGRTPGRRVRGARGRTVSRRGARARAERGARRAGRQGRLGRRRRRRRHGRARHGGGRRRSCARDGSTS